MLQPQYVYRARYVRTVDGDTVDLFIDLGLRTWVTARVRLYGVNSPERGEAGWAEAKAWVAAWFEAHPQVVVATLKDRTEKYGRWLGVVYSSEEVVNDAIVAAGHAKAARYEAAR